jgi:hypothetical protein
VAHRFKHVLSRHYRGEVGTTVGSILHEIMWESRYRNARVLQIHVSSNATI